MRMTTLGQTGLQVSRMGLGCGGHSRLGMAYGASKETAAGIVRAAIDLGVNFIDTAESYGTEEAVGLALEGIPRESIVISTKVGLGIDIGAGVEERPGTAAELKERLHACLKRLRTDYVDIFNLHGVVPEEYPHARDVLLPALLELKAEGKIRHAGITEQFIPDPGHRMLQPAVENDPWEVVMVGFNLLNPSARHRVLPTTQRKGIGTLCMFAVRRALSQPDALRELIDQLVGESKIADELDRNDPLGFLGDNLQEAAYRFCLWEPGIDVVLSGTGNANHLRENAKSLECPQLPPEALARLRQIFGNVDSVTGN